MSCENGTQIHWHIYVVCDSTQHYMRHGAQKFKLKKAAVHLRLTWSSQVCLSRASAARWVQVVSTVCVDHHKLHAGRMHQHNFQNMTSTTCTCCKHSRVGAASGIKLDSPTCHTCWVLLHYRYGVCSLQQAQLRMLIEMLGSLAGLSRACSVRIHCALQALHAALAANCSC
jgi:hypothetical protein